MNKYADGKKKRFLAKRHRFLWNGTKPAGTAAAAASTCPNQPETTILRRTRLNRHEQPEFSKKNVKI